MRNPRQIDEIDLETPENVTPEYLLWVAVVDRAIWDFCTFADWYCQRLTHEYCRKRKRVSNTPEVAMIREYNSLLWFLFDTRPQEFNLQWISEHVFSCGPGLCEGVRRRCVAGHKANLDVYATNERLEPLIALYERRTATKVIPTHVDDAEIMHMVRPRIRRVSRY